MNNEASSYQLTPPKRARTILIVDDTPANLETLYSYFENLGFEIMMAQSGRGALKRVEYVRPDIVLLDVVMPGMDGYETCRRLQSQTTTRQIPIIFMTALTDTVHKVKGFEAGAVDYITKPFQIEEVLARVNTHLALRDLQAQLEEQNKRLQCEIQEKQATAAALQKAKNELELRVRRRTEELARANSDLELEVAERRLAEAEIRKLAAELAQRVEKRTDELGALYEVTALAGQSAQDLSAILSCALESVVAVAKTNCGAIRLAQEMNEVVVEKGLDDLEEARLFNSAAAWIIMNNSPLLWSDPITVSPDIRLPDGFIGVPIRGSGRVIGALSTRHYPALGLTVDTESVSLLTAMADHIGIVIESIRLRRIAEQAATMEERSRLARELHDSVTQLMYSINLFAKASKDAYRLNNHDQGETYLTRLQDSARQALKELRLLLFELRPPQLEQEGLVSALQLRLDAVEGRSGVKTQFLVNVESEIPATYEKELYAIAQEALNNALKHANASAVTIRLQMDGNGIELAIVDDGIGFNPNREGVGRGGMGLTTMRERATNIGSVLVVQSEPGQGTVVQVNLCTTLSKKEKV